MRGGFYKVTRNPMCLSMLMVLSIIAIILGSLIPFLFIPFFIWIVQSLFIFEEKNTGKEIRC